MIEKLKEQSIAQLKEEFNPELDYDLKLERTFEDHPSRGSGLAALFSFQPVPDEPDRFFIFAGNALTMIYPDWNLSPDELWAINIGNEYFIKMGVTEDPTRSAKVLAYVKMVATVFQEQLYITLSGPPKIEKIYALGEQRHVVGHATFDEKVYSWIVGDIPHFVYKKDLPAQTIWSLHMGRILLTPNRR
jgi:hypothetical protein